jgi:hypothetical protein
MNNNNEKLIKIGDNVYKTKEEIKKKRKGFRLFQKGSFFERYYQLYILYIASFFNKFLINFNFVNFF